MRPDGSLSAGFMFAKEGDIVGEIDGDVVVCVLENGKDRCRSIENVCDYVDGTAKDLGVDVENSFTLKGSEVLLATSLHRIRDLKFARLLARDAKRIEPVLRIFRGDSAFELGIPVTDSSCTLGR